MPISMQISPISKQEMPISKQKMTISKSEMTINKQILPVNFCLSSVKIIVLQQAKCLECERNFKSRSHYNNIMTINDAKQMTT